MFSITANRVAHFIDRANNATVPFSLEMPDGTLRSVAGDAPRFCVHLRNVRGLRSFCSFDQWRIANAYLSGDIDITGDFIQVFALQDLLEDSHPWISAWRFLEPLAVGQVRSNARAIDTHYEVDPSFFLSFLDPLYPAYSQGVFESPDEPLSAAIKRKFDYCVDKCELGSNKRVLEIGPGWGAFACYVLDRGVDYVGITNSRTSFRYLTDSLGNVGGKPQFWLGDFLNFHSDAQFDAIVIMGVIEHLPQYGAVIRKFSQLLAPGGFVYLDASAARDNARNSFIVKYIYPGNHRFLSLRKFLSDLESSPLEVLETLNDSESYHLTCRHWASNLDSRESFIRQQFGDVAYRKFRLYLWASAHSFLTRKLESFRLVLHKP